MPWECSGCRTSLTDELTVCPACGHEKTSWTVEADVTRAFVLSTKLRCLGRAPDRSGELRVRLEVDPSDPLAADDRFTLFSKRGAIAAQVKTVADDEQADDRCVDLRFTGLDPALSYSLEVDARQGAPHLAFDDVPYAELVRRGAGPPGPAPAWRPVDRVRAVDKGTLRELARRGSPAPVERALAVTYKGSPGTEATVTVLCDTEVERVHTVTLGPGEGGGAERRLLFAFGAGGLDEIAFDGVDVIDVTEETEEGFAPKVQVAVAGQPAKSLKLEVPGARLRVRLELDPRDPLTADDRFVLTGERGEVHEQVRTIADDLTPGDGTTDLLFVGLDAATRYTLTVHPGGGAASYPVFEERPYADLVRGSA